MKRELHLGRWLCALTLATSAIMAASCQSLAGIDTYTLGPCGDFCDTVMANCTDANKVYASRANCMSVCTTLEPGDPDEPGNANTVACRFAAAVDAASGEADTSCQRAGPGGGNGGCGASDCESYCYLYDHICSEALPTDFPPQKSCLEDCAGLRDDGSLNATDDHEGDTVQCRLVHVSAAKADLAYHCGHARLANPSQYCNNDALTPPRLPNCADFCKLVTHVCTDDLAVYESEDECNALCKFLDPGHNSDSRGQNTVGCRKYHTYNAINDAPTHCPHVGPGGAGVCGDAETGNCDSFCHIASQACTDEFDATYESEADCLAQCADLDPGGKYSVLQAESDSTTLGCRFLALSRAAEDPSLCGDVFGGPGTPCE